MATLRTIVEGERFIHKELWRVVERQLTHADTNVTGSFYDHLVAMVFSFHAFEAYLNYVGDHLAPDIWKDERTFFQRAPYRGFDGKVRKVLELVGMVEPDRSSPPYSTVWLLKGLRDLMVHGKTEKIAAVLDHGVGEEPNRMPSDFDLLISADNARRARDDIFAFSQNIHELARPRTKDMWFGTRAYEGILQHAEGSSTIAS